jgi:two-component system, OmpR family, KDP operon response regulator KdpE
VTTVLVVEDDIALRVAIVTALDAEGYLTTEAGTAEEAVLVTEHRRPDLVLLDLSLPGADGLDALIRMRSFTDVPVVVLTVRDSKADKIAALDGGADDYVTKPFDPDELLARLRAALRRSPDTAPASSVVQFGDLSFDQQRGLLTRNGRIVRLTATELGLLNQLVRADGRLVTQANLIAALSDDERTVDLSSLRVHIRQLRSKLGDDAASPRFIVTQHGLGYRWIATAPGS